MTPQQRPAELRVHRLELALLPETRAVGRVDQYEPGRRDGRGQPCDLAPLEKEDLGETGAVRVRERGADRCLVTVESAQPARLQRVHRSRGERLGAQARPDLGIMLSPALESEAASQQPGGDVRGDQRRLDHDRPGTAHRINEGPAAGRDLGPAATQQQRGGQIFLERRFEGRLAVATLVQRPAGEVDPDRSAVATESARSRADRDHRNPPTVARRHARGSDRRSHPWPSARQRSSVAPRQERRRRRRWRCGPLRRRAPPTGARG